MTHPPDSEAFWEMLARYVSGESTLPEAETVRRWLEEQPERKALVEALAATISVFEVEPAEVDVEAALRAVEERMDGPDVHRLPVEVGGAPVAAPKKARRPRRVTPAADGADRPKSVPAPAATPEIPKAPVEVSPIRQKPILIPAAEAATVETTVPMIPVAETPGVDVPVEVEAPTIETPVLVLPAAATPVVQAPDELQPAAEVETPTIPLRPAANAESDTGGSSRRGWILRVAAAIVVLLGGVAVWQKLPGPRPPATAVTLSTGVGMTDTTSLADGTRVILGPESQLVVAALYGDDNRDVELSGEALFEVVHSEVPFRVTAGGRVIEDLGTVFNVRAIGNEVVVAVTEGSVGIDEIVLKAGDRAVMAAGSAPVLQQGAVTEADLAWTTGQLVLVDAPMTRVVADVRRWYGVEIQVPNETLASRHLNITFGGEPVDEVLQGIADALGAVLTRRDGNVAVLSTGDGTPN